MLALEDVKAWLKVTGTEDDALLTDLEARAQAFLEMQTGRYFGAPKEFVEVLDGGREALRLLEEPRDDDPTTIEEWDGAWIDNLDDVDVTTFWVFRQDRTCWPGGRRHYRVTYTAGYEPDEVPGDIAQAALDLIADKYRYRGNEGLQSETLGQYSYTRADYTRADIERIPGVQTTVDAWRHVSIP